MALILCLLHAGIAHAQSQGSPYINSDVNYESIFGHRTLPLPPSGEVVFDPNTNTVIFSKSIQGKPEQAFVAAWEYCEHLAPRHAAGAHTSSSTPQPADFGNISEQRDDLALKSVALGLCHEALMHRVACPMNSSDSLTALHLNKNCAALQQEECKRLTNEINDPNEPGQSVHDLGDATTGLYGDDEVNSALSHCMTDGLSDDVFDFVMSHRCENDKYVNAGLADTYQGSSVEVEHDVQNGCWVMSQNNDMLEALYKLNFVNAMTTLAQMRYMGDSMSPTGRPVGP